MHKKAINNIIHSIDKINRRIPKWYIWLANNSLEYGTVTGSNILFNWLIILETILL